MNGRALCGRAVSGLRSRVPGASVRHGIKTGLAALLSYLVTEWLHLDFGYWAPITAVIVMQTSVAESIEMSLYRTVGTMMGALMGVVAILALPDTFEGNGAGLFITTGLCAFLTRWDARYRMAAITVTIVILASVGQPDRMHFGLFRVLEILVGVVCAVLVSLTLWPLRAGEALRADLSRQLQAAAERVGVLVEAFLAEQQALPEDMFDGVAGTLKSNHDRLRKARRHESFLHRDDHEHLEALVMAADHAVSHLQAMLHSLNGCRGEGYTIIMAKELRDLAAAASEGLRWLAAPDAATPPPALRSVIDAAEARLTALREDGATRRFYLGKLMQFYAFYHALRRLAEDVEAIVERRQACSMA